MADTIQGTGGNLQTSLVGRVYAKLNTWTASVDHGTLETTGFGDGGYRTYENTLCSMAGSASGLLTDDAPMTEPYGVAFDPEKTKTTMDLISHDGKLYRGDARISNWSVTRSEDGPSVVSFNFVFNGRIIPQWV